MKTNAIIKRAALLGVIVGMAAVNVEAADLVWDADPDTSGIQNGGGTWNLTGTNWWNGSDYVAWPNNTSNGAVFGNGSDAAGVINVVGSVTGLGLTINYGGYVFQGDLLNFDNAGPLTLNAANGTTTFNNVLSVKNISFGAENQTLLLNKGNGSGLAYGNNSTIGGSTVAIAKTSTVKLSGGIYIAQNSFLNIGDTTNNTGGMELISTGTWQIANNLRVGRGAEGLLIINGGVLAGRSNGAGRDIYIADASGTGKILVKAGSLDTTAYAAGANIHVGLNGVGTLEVTGGNVNTGLGNIYVQSANGATGAFKLTGGEVRANGILFGFGAGNYTTGSASFTQSGGILYVGANGINTNAGVSGLAPQITLSGGTLAANASWSSTLKMSLSGNTTTFQTTDANFEGKTITLDNELSGAGALAKTGAGTLFLNAANSYEGGTTVSEGVLSVGAAGILGTGGVFVDGGATLTIGNHLALDQAASLTFADGATINLNFSDPGDTLTLSGVFLDGGLSLAASTYSVAQLNNFFNASVSGDIFFGAGNITVIPEPSTWTLLLTGAALLAVVRRRK